MRTAFEVEQEKLLQVRQSIGNCGSPEHYDSLIFEVERIAAPWGIMNENYQLTDDETSLLILEKHDLRDFILKAKTVRPAH